MIRETVYNDIFDSQRHFRTVLDSMARPGKINRFAPIALNPPPALHRAAAYVGFALLNADVVYDATSLGADAETYLRVNTHAQIGGADKADFIFLHGSGDPACVLAAKVGIPAYPETSASLVIQVAHIGKSSATGGLQLTIEGPGVETREILFVTGLNPDVLAAWKGKNHEFPLGVDALLVTTDECIVCLPRTSRVTWNAA